MNALDALVLGVLLLSTLLGALRGLIGTLFGLAGWVAAALLAGPLGVWAGGTVLAGINDPGPRLIGGIILVFVVVKILVSLTGVLCTRLAKALGLGTGDHLLGAVFGVLRGVALVFIAAVVAGLTPIRDSVLWRSSVSGPLFESLVRRLGPELPVPGGGQVRFSIAQRNQLS
jgi:membrane protein required for colicin V production